MKHLECPHCQESRLSSARFSTNVAAIMQCPACNELVVSFRGKTVGLDRDVLQNGEHEDRKQHLASVIAEFLEPELLDLNLDELGMGIGLGARAADPDEVELVEEGTAEETISDSELRSFTQDELSKLDDSDYFRRHFS